ncbi:unnamed protein product [Cuscuta epithymum]|uniref:Uncharacterized protein n=1 Tax=Cuscuta epithymum TaxID=186058 RepID=A0AAV0DM09_9ASTE|nr:unnamed protein product [Cuscuta epithymum]
MIAPPSVFSAPTAVIGRSAAADASLMRIEDGSINGVPRNSGQKVVHSKGGRILGSDLWFIQDQCRRMLWRHIFLKRSKTSFNESSWDQIQGIYFSINSHYEECKYELLCCLHYSSLTYWNTIVQGVQKEEVETVFKNP